MAAPAPLAPRTPESSFGSPSDYAGTELEALQVLVRYRDWIVDEFRPHLRGHAVEIGAGIGSYSRQLVDSVDRLDMIEPSIGLHQKLVAEFGNDRRITLLRTTVEDWASQVPDQRYDTAVMINVLEHIADDAGVLRQLYRTLRPGGRLLLFVPALMMLYSKLDRSFGHYRRYRRQELACKVAAAGFDVQICRYFDLLGVLPWLVINRWAGAQRFNPTAARLYDRIGVPLTRTIERLVPLPLGKNLLLVASRTDGQIHR
jgi:SAM-dependent methyltransferase